MRFSKASKSDSAISILLFSGILLAGALIYSKLDNSNYVFEGKTTLKDFYRIIKLDDEEIFESKKGEAETIAGFVLEISRSFPKVDSIINFENYVFKIEALDKKRIKQIKVTIKN